MSDNLPQTAQLGASADRRSTGQQDKATTPRMRAFRLTLDPTQAQVADFNRHAGASRWAFNHALALKRSAHQEWRRKVDALVAQGMPEPAARKAVKAKIPTKPSIQGHLNRIKGDSRQPTEPGMYGPHRPCPWWWEVSTYAFQSAFLDADMAWKNWMDSLTGKRAGRKVGYPRFKKKGRARDSFRLHHDVAKPTIRPDGYRRLQLPRIGSVRLHHSNKPLARLIDRGQAVIKSVTIARGGHRWYAMVLCEVHQPVAPITRAQKARGRVGVDLGVKVLAATSKPLALTPGAAETQLIPNPRHADQDRQRLTRAQRAYARTRKGSHNRTDAARRIGRVQHQTAERRATTLHTLTKRLATGFETIAVEDLNVQGMTASARGTLAKPGSKVKQKAGLNRAVLDAAPAELRRQLTYKTGWYGSRLAVLDRWWPSSQTCSACQWRNPSLKLADRTFQCAVCGLSLDRDINAARNIEQHALVASERGETSKTPVEGTEVPSASRTAGSTQRSGKTRPRPGHPRGVILGSPTPRDTSQPSHQPDVAHQLHSEQRTA